MNIIAVIADGQVLEVWSSNRIIAIGGLFEGGIFPRDIYSECNSGAYSDKRGERSLSLSRHVHVE